MIDRHRETDREREREKKEVYNKMNCLKHDEAAYRYNECNR